MKMHDFGAAKHEKVVIFRRKMCGFRMFLEFREREHEEIRKHHGVKDF